MNVEQAVRTWINPSLSENVRVPESPIDTENLFNLFEQYDNARYKQIGFAYGQSTKCCATGTCAK